MRFLFLNLIFASLFFSLPAKANNLLCPKVLKASSVFDIQVISEEYKTALQKLHTLGAADFVKNPQNYESLLPSQRAKIAHLLVVSLGPRLLPFLKSFNLDEKLEKPIADKLIEEQEANPWGFEVLAGLKDDELFPPSDQTCYPTCYLHAQARAVSYAYSKAKSVRLEIGIHRMEAATAVKQAMAIFTNTTPLSAIAPVVHSVVAPEGTSKDDSLFMNERLEYGAISNFFDFKLIAEEFGLVPKQNDFSTDDIDDTGIRLVNSTYRFRQARAKIPENETLDLKGLVRRTLKEFHEAGPKKTQNFEFGGQTMTAESLAKEIEETISFTVDFTPAFFDSGFHELEDALLSALRKNHFPVVSIKNWNYIKDRIVYSEQVVLGTHDHHALALVRILKSPYSKNRIYIFQNSWGSKANPHGLFYCNSQTLEKIMTRHSIAAKK